jgi:hypothetical protein
MVGSLLNDKVVLQIWNQAARRFGTNELFQYEAAELA